MSIGYSALNTSLNISGNVKIMPNKKLEIINATLTNNYLSNEISNTTYEDTKITFNTNITSTSGIITYDITIKNNTNDDYIYNGLKEILVTNKYLSTRIDNLILGTTLKSGEEITFKLSLSSFYNNQTGISNLLFDFVLASDIPSIEGATPLAGATTTTNSYVKTGIYPTNNTKVIINFTIIESKTTAVWLFSSRRAFKNQMFGIAYGSYDGSPINQENLLQFNDISYNFGATGFPSNKVIKAEISKNGLYLNDVLYSDPDDTEWHSIYELYLFANNEAKWIRGYIDGKAVIHNIEIYENDKLILDAKPVILTNGDVAFINYITNTPLITVGSLTPIY